MVFGIKSKIILKIFIFICSVIIMIGSYSLVSLIYKNLFTISSHKSAGMVFVSFFYIYSCASFVILFFYFSKNNHDCIRIGFDVLIL